MLSNCINYIFLSGPQSMIPQWFCDTNQRQGMLLHLNQLSHATTNIN